jgi:Fe-S-cluster-containing dehydrogenase component
VSAPASGFPDRPGSGPVGGPGTRPGPRRLRFVLRPERCTGCEACVLACRMEHRARQTRPWRRVFTFNPFRHPDLPVAHLSSACHHCEEPACLAACPASAYTRDPDTGIVTHHEERCLGCRYCTWACPFGAPRFAEGTGTVGKCTFCAERQARGLAPACAARCPTGALGVEERPPDRAGAPALPADAWPPGLDAGAAARLRPGLRIQAGRAAGPPVTAPAPPGPFLATLLAGPPAPLTLRGEWPLVVFTLTLAVLAAWAGAAVLGGPALRPLPFLGAGAAAMALAGSHLGRPLRAWRAVLNLRRSWLSRELVLVSAFLGLGALSVRVPVLAGAAALGGLAALLAVDRIYRVAFRQGPGNLHSAQVLLEGLYLLGLLARSWPLALGAGGVRALLYLHRKRAFARAGGSVRPTLSLLRLLAGFGAPLVLPGPLAVASAVAGELVDRCEYYLELRFPSPEEDLALRFRQRSGPPDHTRPTHGS